MLISILIPTYRRPEDLTALLGDLLAEARAGAVMEDVEILVLDNCPDRSAEAVVAGWHGGGYSWAAASAMTRAHSARACACVQSAKAIS